MGTLRVPNAPTKYTTQYKELLGVDYLKDATDVDPRRSPDMANMISDLGGNPVKRSGYRKVGDRYASLVTANSIMYGVRETTNNNIIVAKIEIANYVFSEVDVTRIYKNCGPVKSAFGYQRFIFILCKNALLKFDTTSKEYSLVGTQSGMMSVGTVGESAPANTENIPVTVIGQQPNGTAGTTLDDKNLMSIYQTVQYQGDGTAKEFKIAGYEKIGSWLKVEVMDSNAVWQEVSNYTVESSTSLTGKSIDGTSTITSNVISPKITFTTAPTRPPIAGQDNVKITFAPYSTAQIDGVNKGFYNQFFVEVLNSDISIYFSQRLFVADGNRTYYSLVNDPLNISDLNYFDVDNTIMCYTRTSSYLAIITKDNGRNTIYLAQELQKSVTNNNSASTMTYFSLKPSNAGVGAVSNKCIGTLSDEPVFLASTGLYGLLTNWQSEKYAVNRSTRINRKMCKESNLENAVGIAWNDYYYIAINGHMYVMDSRHKDSDRAGNRPYECYYFNNIPTVEQMYVINNVMYFSDATKTYTWNDDLSEVYKYYDNAVMDENGDWSGETVCAKWSSTFDGDNCPQKLKTLSKKGSMITLVPHYKSTVSVTLKKDGDVIENLGDFETDIFTFERIDFTRFVFKSNAVTSDVFTKRKIKKYKRLQIVLESKTAEPFGITNVIKTYTIGNYAKK